MKEALLNKVSHFKDSIRDRTSGLYGPDDLAAMDDGMGTVEIILIIVVLIGLVLIFKKQIRAIVETIMNKISSDSDSVMS